MSYLGESASPLERISWLRLYCSEIQIAETLAHTVCSVARLGAR